jgi:hypothetical protein
VGTDFISMLEDRCRQARARIEHAQTALDDAERDLEKWQEVLEMERKNALLPPVWTEKPVTKTEIVRQAIKLAGKPISVPELIELLKLAVSRSGIYWVVRREKDAGRMTEDAEGKLTLVEKD